MSSKNRNTIIRDILLMIGLISALLLVPQLKAGWLSGVAAPDRFEEANSSNPTVSGRASRAVADIDTRHKDKAFIRELIPVVTTWEANDLKPYLHPETRKAAEDLRLASVLSTLESTLGEFESMKEPVHENSSAKDRIGTLEEYHFSASFERGDADIELVISEYLGENSLYAFDIYAM